MRNKAIPPAFDIFKKDYIGLNNSSNGISTTSVAANEDGSVLERLEWIQVVLGGTALQLRVFQSATGTVEETDIVRFAVSLYDMDTGAIASANIDITSVTQTMERSRNGSAYSAISDPTVSFSKGTGIVYMDYEFKAAQWQVGDMYRMSLSGITCTIGSDTAYVPAMIWNNIVISGFKMPEWVPVAAVPINTTAVVSPGVDIIDLKDTDLKETYRLNNVRFKFADPGVNTITITLSELINDVAVTVDTFTVTTANYGDYHSLMDMFGVPYIAGDAILINVTTSAGSYAFTGQYQYDIAYNA